MNNSNERQQLWIILLIVFIGFVGTSIAYPIFLLYFYTRRQVQLFLPPGMKMREAFF